MSIELAKSVRVDQITASVGAYRSEEKPNRLSAVEVQEHGVELIKGFRGALREKPEFAKDAVDAFLNGEDVCSFSINEETFTILYSPVIIAGPVLGSSVRSGSMLVVVRKTKLPTGADYRERVQITSDSGLRVSARGRPIETERLAPYISYDNSEGQAELMNMEAVSAANRLLDRLKDLPGESA